MTCIAYTCAECGSLPPAYELFTRGYDLSSIELLNPKWHELEAVCNYNFMCKRINLCQWVIARTTFLINFQLIHPLNVGGDATVEASVLVQPSQSFREQLALTGFLWTFLGVSIFLPGSEFAGATVRLCWDSYQPHGCLSNGPHDSSVVEVMNLSIHAASAMATLPQQFNESTVNAFQSVIDRFGTHYMDQGIFGCKFEYVVRITTVLFWLCPPDNVEAENVAHSNNPLSAEVLALHRVCQIVRYGGGRRRFQRSSGFLGIYKSNLCPFSLTLKSSIYTDNSTMLLSF